MHMENREGRNSSTYQSKIRQYAEKRVWKWGNLLDDFFHSPNYNYSRSFCQIVYKNRQEKLNDQFHEKNFVLLFVYRVFSKKIHALLKY